MTKDEDSCIWGGLSGSNPCSQDRKRYGTFGRCRRYVGVSKPSVCHAVNVLCDGGFLTKDDKHFISLTEEGRKIAEKIYERHKFFKEQLISAGVSPNIAETEACRIEHCISDESFLKLKQHHEKDKG